MSRPRKYRKVCHFPNSLSFSPAETPGEKEPVLLTVDEYETIRLIAPAGLSQDACAAHMQVARTTVQAIYVSARQKLADMLVNGKRLVIRGGAVEPCADSACRCSDCHKKFCGDNKQGCCPENCRCSE